MEGNSVITLYRRRNLCEIASGKVASIPPVTKIAFGAGGVDADGLPIAPEADAAGLNDEIARYDIDGVTYPVPTTARYTVTVPADDLAGASISEAALIDSDGEACAINTFYVKRKDGGVAFTFTFDDEF